MSGAERARGLGAALAFAAFAAPAAAQAPPFDAGRLVPGEHRYRVTIEGEPVGEVTTTLERGVRRDRSAWRATSRFESGSREAQQVEVWFDAETFAPLETSGTADRGGHLVSIRLTYADGRVEGQIEVAEPATADAPQTQSVDLALPPGTLDQNQVRYALLGAPLASGDAFEVPIFDVTGGQLVRLSLRAAGVETVSVPAGRFRAHRVEMTGGPLPMTWYVTTQSPRRIVRQEFDSGGSTVRVEMLPGE